MAEQKQIIPKDYQVQADDHYHQGLENGNWLESIHQPQPEGNAVFNAKDHQLQHGLENQQQQDPAPMPIDPQQ